MGQRLEEIISDAELDKAAGNANFGKASKRDVIAYALLQSAYGYSTGYTARCMMEDLGLVSRPRAGHGRRPVPTLLKKGKRYLWVCFGKQSF